MSMISSIPKNVQSSARVLNESSLVVFDKRANDKRNLNIIVLDRNNYLTSKKLNIADDRCSERSMRTSERVLMTASTRSSACSCPASTTTFLGEAQGRASRVSQEESGATAGRSAQHTGQSRSRQGASEAVPHR